MTNQTTWILFVLMCIFGGAAIWASADVNLPGNDQGYAPEQPISFSHRLHAGEMKIDCQYCHSGADRSRHAGIPALGTCMNCHKTVRAPFADVRAEAALAKSKGRSPKLVQSPEIQKIYDGLGLDDNLKPDPTKKAKGIEWVKVHDLPDFVFFDHSRHINAGVDCQKCHGPVETMERVRQFGDLSMGSCVNCHRDVNENGLHGNHALNASTDCVGCHY